MIEYGGRFGDQEKRKQRNDSVHGMNLKRLHANGRYFPVNKEYLWIMPFEEACLLSFLCNLGYMDGRDWFRCTIKQVIDGCNTSKAWHNRVIASLEKKGYIQRRREGMPPKRMIWIDYERLESELQSFIVNDFRNRKEATLQSEEDEETIRQLKQDGNFVRDEE